MPYDYAVEVASNAWFGSLVWPGAVGRSCDWRTCWSCYLGQLLAVSLHMNLKEECGSITGNCKEGEPSSTYFGVR